MHHQIDKLTNSFQNKLKYKVYYKMTQSLKNEAYFSKLEKFLLMLHDQSECHNL
jgi:hypothetical protein